MTKLVTIDFLPTQWTNDALTTLLSRFSGVLRSHVMVNKDNRSLGFAIVEMAHSHQREGLFKPWTDGLLEAMLFASHDSMPSLSKSHRKMKQFYSHALLLLVQLQDDRPPCRIVQNEIDTPAMNRHISWSEVSVRQSLPFSDMERNQFSR